MGGDAAGKGAGEEESEDSKDAHVCLFVVVVGRKVVLPPIYIAANKTIHLVVYH